MTFEQNRYFEIEKKINFGEVMLYYNNHLWCIFEENCYTQGLCLNNSDILDIRINLVFSFDNNLLSSIFEENVTFSDLKKCDDLS